MKIFINTLFSILSAAQASELFLMGDHHDLTEDWIKDIDLNKQPVIGILSQSLETFMQNDTRFANYTSYMMSSYVKFIEAQGARVVPIIYGEPKNVTLDKLAHIDGVLLPGGGGDDYELGKLVFEQIKKYNDEGHFYPAWGTCLGYENLVSYTADAGQDVLGRFPLHNASVPLRFLMAPEKTRMYKWLAWSAIDLQKYDMLYNNHDFGISPDAFKSDKGLAEFWDVTAMSFLPNGTAFTASVESKKYPIFGTQFHPEKPSEEFVNLKINHTWESVQIQEHFARYFVAMARANPNTYGNFEEVQKHEISNYDRIQTGEHMADVYVFH